MQYQQSPFTLNQRSSHPNLTLNFVWEQFARDFDEDRRREQLIRAEMNRRKEAGPLPGQTEKQFEYSCRYHEVQIDLTKEHGWYRLYVD